MKEKFSQRASILILSLWSLMFLSIIAVYSGVMVRQEITAREKIASRNKLYDVAYSGIMMAMDLVNSPKMRDATPGFDSLNDFWADSPYLFKNVRFPDGACTLLYDYNNNFSGLKELKYGVVDEERKVNINYVNKDVIKRLLVFIGGLEDTEGAYVANAIVDWHDSDDILYNDERNLSEAADYMNSGYDYTPKNTHFALLEELLLVKGMNRDIFFAIKDYITVFSNGLININTVSQRILLTYGLGYQSAEMITSFRAGADMKEGTSDDNLFVSATRILETLSSYYDIPEAVRVEIVALVNSEVLAVESQTFTAVCQSSLSEQDMIGRIMCVFERSGRIKYWGCGYDRMEELS
ncbi:general secretion pathway protein GspK [Candidatus Omnitrophota bacterium]